MVERDALPVAQARVGNPAAWDTLFRRYQLPLFVYVLDLLREEQASLDIVQETFISAAQNIATLRADDKFAGWLFGIAHQKCIRRWRKRKQEEFVLEESGVELVDPDEGPDALLIRREHEEELMRCLDQLSTPQSSVLLLYYMENFSIETIGEITGVPSGTVKSRLHYAKQALRKLLDKEVE
jgi:RNA polymerase sigma-70 factor, ECF subfamily